MPKKALFMNRNLVERVTHLVRAGVMDEPVWLDVAKRIPPLDLKKQKKAPKPEAIVFPEDRLIQSFYARHPEARAEPIDLGSDVDLPLARQYALKQLALMQTGMSRKRAEAEVEQEFFGKGGGTNLFSQMQRKTAGWYSTTSAIQAEEERELFAAMRTRRRIGGPAGPAAAEA